MQDHPTLVTAAFSKPRSFFYLRSSTNTTRKISEIKLRKNIKLFGLWKKYLSYIFPIWKNIYHKDFPQIFVRMESYGKDFFCILKLYD